jgi:thiol-disulfide isomerase/thioredoxin
MKKSLFFFIILLLPALTEAQEKLVLEPSKPQPGAAVTIRYNPKNTPLSGLNNIEGYVYLLEGGLPAVHEVQLTEENGRYVASFSTNNTTKAFFIAFTKDDIWDNNGRKGYYSAIYDKKGQPLPGANLALAKGFGNHAGIWRMTKNADLAVEFANKEFTSPASRKQFYSDYWTHLADLGDKSKAVLRTELKKAVSRKDITEADLNKIKFLYEKTLRDSNGVKEIIALQKNKFPNGAWKILEKIAQFDNEADLQKKASLFHEMLSDYPSRSNEEQEMLDNLAKRLARGYADAGKFDLMHKYASLIQDGYTRANVYNLIATRMSGGALTRQPVNAVAGLEASAKAFQIITEEIKKPTSKPPYATDKEWKKTLTDAYYRYHIAHATLLYHNGQLEEAYATAKEAADYVEGENMNIIEAFAFLAEKVRGVQEAQSVLESFICEGKSTPAMKDQLKAIYLASNTQDQWTKYLEELEKRAYNKLKSELAKKMISVAAPHFALKDLSGKEVSLASLKGKIVVLDVWATWCGPCIASFPAMQKAIHKYRDNPDVVFLFVNTLEGGVDREKKVSGFIEKNKYSFNVLYDDPLKPNTNEFKLVADYAIEVIPTKFIIDGNNNIRFKSAGYNGSIDGLIMEITAMIELAAAPR